MFLGGSKIARKTFISYKYSESTDLRDRIIKALGKDVTYYQGENADSEDMSLEKEEKIKEKLKNSLHDTSVLIVILSPNMRESKWIDWEISYALREKTRKETRFRPNGIVAVLSKVNGSYDWAITTEKNIHGQLVVKYKSNIFSECIESNRYNSNVYKVHCERCLTYYKPEYASYVEIVEEDDFLKDPQKYIERAYEKRNGNYKLQKNCNE